MARGNPPVEVRVDPATRDRWQAEARDRGCNLSEFVRDCVEAQIGAEAGTARGTRAKPVRAKAETVQAPRRGDLGAADVSPRFKGGDR